MILLRSAVVLCAAATGLTAQAPLPGLRVEAVDAGSILYVKNRAAQPLTAFLIELVDYPGSSFTYLHDDLAETLAPGVEKRIAVGNMLPGAVPDSVKLEAAIFADGSTSGVPAKVARLLERRRTILETTREAIRRIGAGDRAAELRTWAESLRTARDAVAAGVASKAAERLAAGAVDAALEALRQAEGRLASSKPALVR
jgi:hypothetical protein